MSFRADQRQDGAGVAAGEALEFAHGHLLGIAGDAAFGAAKGDVHDGALPCHPRGQGLDFVQGDVGVEADAALGGPRVVLCCTR